MVTSQEIEHAAQIIRNGGLVAFPTETVYGLGADALNPMAVTKIFAAKERPSFDPLIVHIAHIDEVKRLTKGDDIRVTLLAQRFWPGPLTIVLPKNDIVPDIVTSGLKTVGIRMPDNPVALELISKSGCPISAPSANKFSRISPTSAEHVKKQLPKIDYILDGGRTSIGIESTVITLNNDGFVILRKGTVTSGDLEQVLPQSSLPVTEKPTPTSPGLMDSHYSPEKPLFMENKWNNKNAEYLIKKGYTKGAYLSFSGKAPLGFKTIEYLSSSGDLREAAINLFAALHNLEENPDINYIVAEPIPETGIGIAIMDKLKKAAFRYKDLGKNL